MSDTEAGRAMNPGMVAAPAAGAEIPAGTPGWARRLRRATQYLSEDCLGGPRPLKFSWVINFQKAGTFPLLLGLLWVYRNGSTAAWVYLAMHGSYGLVWLLKDLAFPDRRWQVRITLAGALNIFIGVLGWYWVFGWLLISRPTPDYPLPEPAWLALAISVCILGCVTMIAADAQKYFTLRHRPGLITDGVHRYIRHPNYLGEMLVYASFALLVWHWLPVVVLAWVWLGVFAVNMRIKEASLARYPGWDAYRRRSWWLLPFVFAAALIIGGPAGRLAAQQVAPAWSAAPLRSPTPVPRDGLVPGRAEFFRWLTGGKLTLTEAETRSVRERVYVYISELAKQRGGRFPAPGDTTAAQLFRIAAGLGVTGADQVAHAIAPRLATESVPLPSGVTLRLDGPDFSLTSDDRSWAVCFPWYFMPSPAGRQLVPANQVTTEVTVLSTLFAPDHGAPGSSQATILILAARPADSTKHVALWLGQLGLSPEPSAGPADLGEWYAAPGADAMRRQAVIRRLPERVVIAAFLGLGGTFENNRPHFLDVLRTLAPGQCAR